MSLIFRKSLEMCVYAIPYNPLVRDGNITYTNIATVFVFNRLQNKRVEEALDMLTRTIDKVSSVCENM